jgi:hypothetical protein
MSVRKNSDGTRKFSQGVDEIAMASPVYIDHQELEISVSPTSRLDTSARAARLLDAWVGGDRGRLDYELSQFRKGDCPIEADDRDDLLCFLAQQMMDEPDLFAPRTTKLHLGVWVDMLVHLAHPL